MQYLWAIYQLKVSVKASCVANYQQRHDSTTSSGYGFAPIVVYLKLKFKQEKLKIISDEGNLPKEKWNILLEPLTTTWSNHGVEIKDGFMVPNIEYFE